MTDLQGRILPAGEDWLYIKGHVDITALADVASAEYGIELEAADVEHVHLRCVPAPPNSEYDVLLYLSALGHGAFPATLARLY